MKTTPSVPVAEVADLAAAIREALSPPSPAHVAEADTLLAADRAGYVQGCLRHLATAACSRTPDGAHDVTCLTTTTASVRDAITACPVFYDVAEPADDDEALS